MQDNTHNGWTNYATWRINLEIFDDIDTDNWQDEIEDGISAYELGEMLQDYTEEILMECENELTESYALAFIDKVNWGEIAQGIMDVYKENYCCDNCNKRLDEADRFCSDSCKKEYGVLVDHPKG